MDNKVYLNGKTLNKGYRDSWAKRLEEEAEKRLEQQAEQNQKVNAAKTDDGKQWWEKAGELTAGLGKGLLAGAQQGIGRVADVALKGGALLNEASNQIKGGTEEEKNKRRQASQTTVESLREGIKSNKDITGESIRGSKDIGIEDLDDPMKVAELAGEGLGTALDATALMNPAAIVAQGGRMTGKELLKTTARDAAFYGGLDTAAQTANTFGETGDIEESLGQGIKTGLTSAATQGALNLGAAGVGSAIGSKARKAEQAELKATQAADAEALDRPFKDVPDEELRAQMDDFLEGNNRPGDVKEAYSQLQGMKDELAARERNQYFANGGVDADTARKQLEDFDAGKLPEQAYRPAAPVKSLEEVLERPDVPVELKSAAQEIATDRQLISQQLDSLMSPQTKADEIMRLDEQYDLKIKELTQRYAKLEEPTTSKDTTTGQTKDGQRLSGDYKSDIRFSMAKEQLDEDYKNAVAELDMLEAQDMDQVSQYTEMLDKIDQREQNIVLDTRQLMKAAPDEFRDVDSAEAEAIRAQLQEQLTQAERFASPEGIVSEVSTSPDPVKSFESNPDAPAAFANKTSSDVDAMSNTAVADNFQNISGVKAAMLRLMSPSQILKNLGLRNETIDIHSDILRAESAVNLANKADSEVLTRINTMISDDKQVQGQIVDYLEGKRKTLSSINDQEAADMIRTWLDEKKAGIEEMGFKSLDDYFPHMFDKNDPNVARLFKGKTTGDINFGNLKQRLSDSDDYSRDVMNVLAQYASSFNRKKFLEPALKPLDDVRVQAELQGADGKAVAQWSQAYLEQLKGFDKSQLGDGYNQFMDGVFNAVGMKNQVGKDHYTQTLGTQRMISAAATMGLNPGTAIRNLTQMVNTTAEIGPRYSMIGAVEGARALRAGPNSVEWKELERVGIMDGGVSQNYFDAITKPGIVGRASKARDTTVKALMSLIRGTDISLRTQAYYGAKALATKQGLTGKAAEDFAIRKVIDTQFVTSRVDMPVAFNGQAIRSLTQLATFSGKQAGFLKRMGVKLVKGENGTFQMKDAGSILSAVVMAGVATEALKPLLGFKETEWIPFYDQIAPFVPGNEENQGDSLYRSPLVRLLAGDGKSKMGLIEALQTGDIDGLIKDQWSSVVPAGTQIKKSIEGFNTTQTGVSKNDKGNIRYLQDMNVDEQVKASIFGQYSTEAGRNWIKEGFPTLTEKQTQKVESQGTREEQEVYADFYSAIKNVDYKNDQGTGRQAAYDVIKEAAVAGNTNKAQKVAAEYNDAVDKAMAQYWSKHQELPEELRDQMHNQLRIKVNKVIENARE